MLNWQLPHDVLCMYKVCMLVNAVHGKQADSAYTCFLQPFPANTMPCNICISRKGADTRIEFVQPEHTLAHTRMPSSGDS